MALLADYTAGTISVAEGETVVTGDGVAWKTAGFREGDIFIAAGYWAVLAADLADEDALVLVDWAGPTLTDAPYRLRYMSDGSRASAQARQLIDMLGGSGSLEALAALSGIPNTIPYFTGAGTMALLTRQELTQGVHYDVGVDELSGRDAYDDRDVGFSVLVRNIGDGRSAIYSREGEVGNWSNPAYVTGPVGPEGPEWLDWKGEWSAGTYSEGDGVEHNGSSYRANTETSQEPPHEDWDLVANKGGIGPEWIDWRGDWSAGEYTAGQGVTHEGSGYRANTTTTNAPPHADWDLIVSKGGKGDKGEGLAADITVDTLTDRDEYDDEEPPFRIQVRDIGDGRSALYDKESAASGDWSAPAYVTGSSSADAVSYSNATSGLAATDVQNAVDELAARPTVGAADDITYDNSGSDLDAENIQAAVDELAARPAIPPGYDQLRTSVAYQAMLLADVINFAVFPAQDRFADSFDALTYVDVAGATNLDTGTAGVLKPTLSTSDEQSTTGTGVGQAAGWTYVNRSFAVDNGAVVSGILIWSNNAYAGTARILRRDSGTSYTAVAAVSFSHTGGSAWQFFAFGSPVTIPGSGSYYVSIFSPSTTPGGFATNLARSYYNGDVTGTQASGWTEEASGNAPSVGVRYITGSSNLNVATTAIPLAGQPDVMSALVLVREIDTVTPNTDFGVQFSRNDGANWVSATLTLVHAVPIAGGITLKMYTTNDVDMTGHAFATACRTQFWTGNAKMVEFHAHHTYGA